MPAVEDIQDLVEETLMNARYHDVARAYILYRAQQNERRKLAFTLQSGDMIEDYIFERDWYVKENANVGKSMQGLNLYISAKVSSDYWLYRIYPPEIRKAHLSGDLHIHDLGILAPYCCGWDLRYVLKNGFPTGIPGKLISGPPKHFSVALLQSMNAMFVLQGENAGANAFNNFDTYLAPGIHYDRLNYEGLCSIFQSIQGYMYLMGVPTRVGGQNPFTNVTLDVRVPKFMENEKVLWGGKYTGDVYGDFQDEIDMFNKALVEVYSKGDYAEQPFSFPIPTYNITPDFDWEIPGFWEMVAKYGTPYFGNFMPQTGLDVSDVRSMCCHLRLDNKELTKRGGGLFNAYPLTGSAGVVTINLARIGYLSKSEDDFFERLDHQMNLAKDSLILKKKAVEDFTKAGLYPYSKTILRPIMRKYGGYWSNHFLTFGCIGMHEACGNFLGEGIQSPEGLQLAKKTLDFMVNKSLDYQNENINPKGYPENIFNIEATPCEGATYRLALADKRMYPKMIVANEQFLAKGAEPFLTNSTQLPVNIDWPINQMIAHQQQLQPMYTGGTVHHILIGENNPSPEGIKKIVQRVSANSVLPYFTITPTISVCPTHRRMSGEFWKCPICGKDCEVYSRIVGYYRPVSQWNAGKRSEFTIRKTFAA